MSNPANLLLSLANHDNRIYLAFNITTNNFVYLNPAFTEFFQLSDAHTTPKVLFSMVHKDDENYLRRIYHELRPGVFKDNIEFRMLLPDRKEYALRLSILLDVQENQDQVITGYIEDITGYKMHEEKLRDLSNKKNSILNILSHDLAGPLGSIQNFAYLLAKKINAPQDEQVTKMISSIEKISKRCIQMIQEFIKLEFIESVGVDLVRTRINFVERLEAFLKQYLQSENDLKKTFEYQTSHPDIYVDIDENKFFQVINNLISNAMKFTPDGGTISITVEQKETTVLIVVADNGIGIPEKFHDTLFEKFPGARRAGLKGEPSVGLGMSIIKTIVEWHHGKIWFQSVENKGSTFFIEIPTTV